jgi:ribosomal subunit interface protein
VSREKGDHPQETNMDIDIQARDFSVTQAIREYIKRRIGYALSTRLHHIKGIVVRLADVNGPRGGKDKYCQVQVRLPRLATVVVEDTETDLYVAIDRAAERASRTVARRLTRQRDKGRTAFVPDRNLITRQVTSQ